MSMYVSLFTAAISAGYKREFLELLEATRQSNQTAKRHIQTGLEPLKYETC
jgi:hypothetical protein